MRWLSGGFVWADGGFPSDYQYTSIYRGIIAVIMLIIGGIKYVLSGGDSKKVTDAKNTVLYAIIGLVIAVFSYAIVNFVSTSLPSSEQQVNPQGAAELVETA